MNASKLNPWYVTGFCDGEAAFTFSRCSVSMAACFSIRQRNDNDLIVKMIRDFFGGIGSLYIGKEIIPRKNSGHTKETIYFRVSKIEELIKIVDHFDKFPLISKKKEAYAAWKELVLYKHAHYGGADRTKLEEFARKISSLNQKSRAFIKRQQVYAKSHSDL